MIYAYYILVGNPTEKRVVGWEDNIRIDLRE
jgi:hypothetical protein